MEPAGANWPSAALVNPSCFHMFSCYDLLRLEANTVGLYPSFVGEVAASTPVPTIRAADT